MDLFEIYDSKTMNKFPTSCNFFKYAMRTPSVRSD